ncbi:hypothetical protein BANRA_04440 [Klebsiella pneumoniae]|nr:hypothetical protein BANRA_04440 [Klebsiella pneumoniae]
MRNFRRTLSYCTEEFIALCDQDDYWVSDKLEKMLQKFEGKDSNIPILVFSDLQIVDGSLNQIHASFFTSSSKSSLSKNLRIFLLITIFPVVLCF